MLGDGRKAAGEMESPEVLSLLRLLWEVDDGLRLTSRRIKSRYHISGRERFLLKLLASYPGIDLPGLTGFVGASRPEVLRGLKRLQQRGFVELQPAAPGVTAGYRLSPEGERVGAAWQGTVEQAVRVALRSMPREAIQSGTGLLLLLATALRRSAKVS